MRKAWGLSRVLFNTVFLLCSLALVVALVFTGAGLLAIISVFVAVLAFFFLPYLPSPTRPQLVRGLSRRSFPRAPPRS